jgi:type III pantothenate kinase
MIGARHHMLRRLKEPRYAATTIGARPLVVVMVGTAVTIEALLPDGKFIGGMILPGHGIMLKSLQAGTAGLHVPTGEVAVFPTNTSDALTTGGTFAIAGAIETMYSNLQHHCGIKPWCYISGGAAWKMQAYIRVPFELIDELLFEGLLVAAQAQS